LEPNGCAILMATRWHRDDPSGYLLSRAETGEGEPVLHIHLPAIPEPHHPPDSLGRADGEPLWPERWPLHKLLRIKKGSSAYWWNAMYQGVPTAHTAVEWPDSYFGPSIWCSEPDWPQLHQFKLRILTLDPSKGRTDRPGDPSAIVFVGMKDQSVSNPDPNLYVDCSILRRPIDTMCADFLTWSRKYKPHLIGIESNAFQEVLATHFAQMTRNAFGIEQPVFQIENMINKQIRIRRLSPYLSNHQLRLRKSSPGCQVMLEQLRDFPLASHDDGPDALEMAVRLPMEYSGQQ
jgi:predicted phage terminase large subunit-like protein